MNLKAFFSLAAAFVIAASAFSIYSSAEEPAPSEDIDLNAAAEEIGIDLNAAAEEVPPDILGFMEEKSLTADNPDAMTAISPKEVFLYMWESLKESVNYPIRALTGILAVILLSSVISGMGDAVANKPISKIYNVISVAAAAGIVSDPVSECIKTAAETLNSGGVFMLSFVPIFTGVAAASGSVTSSVSYGMAVVMAAEAAVRLAASYIMPLLSVCMALGIIEALNPGLSLTGITKAVSKVSTFVIGFITVVFIGLLSAQSIVGASADTLGLKAAKFLASNLIPVIGGAVSDAYATVRSSLGLLRGGVGFFGIAVIFIMTVPAIIQTGVMCAAFFAGSAIADVFGVKPIKTLLDNTFKILTLVFSILICFSIMLIVSTTILMLIGLNVS